MRLCLFAAVAALFAYALAPSEAMARRYEQGSATSSAHKAKGHKAKAKSHRTHHTHRAYKSRRHHAHRGHSASRRYAHRSHKASRRSAHRTYRSHRTYAAYRGSDEVSYSRGSVRGNNGRPRKWCGWWMRQQRGGGPELNVAWNWSRWGRPAGPQVGAVVVWRHHVGEIVGRAANGQWIVRSGNDGGRVRTRARSVAGAVFRVG